MLIGGLCSLATCMTMLWTYQLYRRKSVVSRWGILWLTRLPDCVSAFFRCRGKAEFAGLYEENKVLEAVALLWPLHTRTSDDRLYRFAFVPTLCQDMLPMTDVYDQVILRLVLLDHVLVVLGPFLPLASHLVQECACQGRRC